MKRVRDLNSVIIGAETAMCNESFDINSSSRFSRPFSQENKIKMFNWCNHRIRKNCGDENIIS